MPDPLSLAITAIEAGCCERQVEVEVCIHAPESVAEGFDDWGRPRAEFWQQRILQQPGDEMIQLAANPIGQKDSVLDFLRNRRKPSQHAVAVGCADNDALSVVRRGLESVGVAVFDPEGEPFHRHGLYHFLASFANLLRDGRFRDFHEMLRNSAWLDSLGQQFDESKKDRDSSFDPVRVLEAFDSLYERVLPGSIEDARGAMRRDKERDDKHSRPLPGQWFAADKAAAMLNRFREQSFGEAAAGLLSDWLGKRQVHADEADAQLLTAVGERSRELAKEMAPGDRDR